MSIHKYCCTHDGFNPLCEWCVIYQSIKDNENHESDLQGSQIDKHTITCKR